MPLTFVTAPPGFDITLNAARHATPFTESVIVGSSNTVSAISPQTRNGLSYFFTSWSNGETETHSLVAPSNPQTLTATYELIVSPTLLKAAYNFNAGSGATVTDQAGGGNTLQLTNATWTAQGHTGGAVQFSGINGSRAELPARRRTWRSRRRSRSRRG